MFLINNCHLNDVIFKIREQNKEILNCHPAEDIKVNDLLRT